MSNLVKSNLTTSLKKVVRNKLHATLINNVKKNKKAVALLDRSGSMDWSEKMDQAKNALEPILQRHHLRLIAFDTAAEEISSERLREVKASGGTKFIPAFDLALSSPTSLIILITDGQPDEGLARLLDYKSGRLEGVELKAIGIGRDCDWHLLEQLCGSGKVHKIGELEVEKLLGALVERLLLTSDAGANAEVGKGVIEI